MKILPTLKSLGCCLKLLAALALATVTSSAAATATVTLRPQYVDISSATSPGAVLVTLSGYTASSAPKYRLYNNTVNYNCWDPASGTFVSSSVYANGPLAPGDYVNGTTFWILYQAGGNLATAASYRDRISPYSANLNTTALPVATAISSPFNLTGTVLPSGSYDLTVRYAVLGFDATSGGNLLCASFTDTNTGNFTLVCQGASTVRRVEFRTIANTTISVASQTGTWTTTTALGSISLGSSPTNPSGVGAANTNVVIPGQTTLLTVSVTPGATPTSTGLSVTGNLASVGGSTTQAFYDDGSHGDVTAGDNIFSFSATVSGGTTAGIKTLPVSISDAQSRSGSASITLYLPIATNIAYLRTLVDGVNYLPTDTTNLYIARGTVTTYTNLTTSGNAQFYMQDATAGITVFVSGSSSVRPNAGDIVEVRGPLGHFNGLLELNLVSGNPLHSVTTISTNNPIPAPAQFSFTDANNVPLMETNVEGRLVVVSNVFFDGSLVNFPTNGGNVTMTNLNGDTFVLRVDARVADIGAQPMPRSAASVVGVMAQSDTTDPRTTNYQILPSRRADILDATVVISVTNRIYNAFRPDLTAGTYTYLDCDPAAGSPVRATQRSLGYREVDYKSQVPPTLTFSQPTPSTNGFVVTYDYSTQAAKTNQVGFWVDKDLPIIIGPDGNAYITDGHHTTAGYMAAHVNGRQFVPGLNFVVMGHIVANYYNPANPQAPDDTWWTARASENNAYLYGTNGNSLTQPAEPNYASLQPILPGTLAMPVSPSTNGSAPMFNSVGRSLAWGLADAVVVSATDSSNKKIAGFKKAAPGSSVDINFVEFFWADYLRNRIAWDNSLSGSPYGSPNGDASVIAAPLSFFAATANGIALARSEAYRDQYGRSLSDYTNSTLFGATTVNWANGSLSNGLAKSTDTYHLYLRDDSSIVGSVQPSALSTNILHIDTASSLTVTQSLQNISTLVVNGGGKLATSWKDATVTNSTLTLPAGSGVVTLPGTPVAARSTLVSNGTLVVSGTLNSPLSVAGGTLKGNGTVNGSLAILSAGTLAPGASIGTLTVTGAVTLAGSAVMEADKTGGVITSDLLTGISTLTYGGALTISFTGEALVAGDTVKLFDAAVYQGAFTTFNLPALDAGLVWDSSRLVVDGKMQVLASGSPALGFASQPASRTNDVGTAVTLQGGAVGTVPIAYQWRYNGTDLAGQTSSALVFGSLQESNQGSYVFVASNAFGAITSAPAVVTVNQAPVAQSQSVTLYWNNALNISLSASDADGAPLTYTVNQPAHGTVTGTAPSVVYTPTAGYTGSDSFTFKVSDGRLNSATVTVSITVLPGFTYQDTDLLLVFRKDSYSDVLFNLGSVSNYLGLTLGTAVRVTNWNYSLVLSNFGGDLSGVKYALLGATPATAPMRAWFSDGDAANSPTDETFSKWSGQHGKVNAIGAAATTYYNSSNQSLVLPSSDVGSYTFIASSGGTLDVTTMGGTVPFPVEQDWGAGTRLFELKVSGSNPKPASVEVGGFNLSAGGQLSFTAGVLAPAITSQPAAQSVECGGSASFTVSATGDALSYQWYLNSTTPVGSNSASLTVIPASVAGNYTVVVTNTGGAVTSSVAALSLSADLTAPVLSLPANFTVYRNDAAGATNVTFPATANDACAGSVAAGCTPASGSTFAVGTTTVNCSATDGANTAHGSFTVTVAPGFTYQDTDLLLVFRKDGFSDVLFNLGSVSNYLGLAPGTPLAVANWNFPLVQANFGGSLSGVKYALFGATPATAPLRAWFSDGDAASTPTDETFSKWSGQRGKVNAIGAAATTYYNSSNQSLILPSSDVGSYTFIASSGGTLDVTTMGGTVPFPVEQDWGAGARLFELKVSGTNPKPASVEVGGFNLSAGGQLSFTAGVLAPAITSQPAAQSVECGGSASFTVSATGDALGYQWYLNSTTPVGGNSATLTVTPATLAGNYTVVVMNTGGAVTSSVAALSLSADLTAPVLSLPANFTVYRNDAAGATNVSFTATANDACAGSVAVGCTPASGSTFAVGTTTVNCSATDGANTAHGSFTVTVAPGFTYQDTDLLLVFRKDGSSDVLFNLGSVSNYLGLTLGTAVPVTNWNYSLVLSNFGGSLSGVKYALLGATPATAPLRAWFSDGDAANTPTDETFSKWSGQHGKVNAIGAAATTYYNSSNQSLILPSSDVGSYTFIASSGGTLDVTTMGGTVPFPVEIDFGGWMRLFELKVSATNPKPVAAQVGAFTLGSDGQLTFAAGIEQQVVGQVALEAYVGPAHNGYGSRSVTFKATDSGGARLATWTQTLSFVPGAGGYGVASYTLNNVPSGTAAISAKTAWNLRKRLAVAFSGGQGLASFTGASVLPAGDIDDSNLVDIQDYFKLAAAWYRADAASDIDGSGLVNGDDYFLLAARWYEAGEAE